MAVCNCVHIGEHDNVQDECEHSFFLHIYPHTSSPSPLMQYTPTHMRPLLLRVNLRNTPTTQWDKESLLQLHLVLLKTFQSQLHHKHLALLR